MPTGPPAAGTRRPPVLAGRGGPFRPSGRPAPGRSRWVLLVLTGALALAAVLAVTTAPDAAASWSQPARRALRWPGLARPARTAGVIPVAPAGSPTRTTTATPAPPRPAACAGAETTAAVRTRRVPARLVDQPEPDGGGTTGGGITLPLLGTTTTTTLPSPPTTAPAPAGSGTPPASAGVGTTPAAPTRSGSPPASTAPGGPGGPAGQPAQAGGPGDIGCDLIGPGGVGGVGPGETSAQATAVSDALALLGTPYVWGGESTGGFDCSGLVQYVFRAAGVSLPRVAQAQYDAGPAVPTGGVVVPGDLVFFGDGPNDVGHVGIFVGQGLMVDAPHTGALVRLDPVVGFAPLVGVTSPGGLPGG